MWTGYGVARRVALDSREVLSGDLFVALRGNRTDGHAFVGQALSRGARCLLVEISKLEEIRPGLGGASCLAVPDPELALAEMASHWLKLVSPVVVGITGSVGKTTTREVILSLLGRRFKVHGSPKSYNTLIGLSATVMGMDRGCDNLVLEYGTSSFGEISKLVSYFPPDEMVITEVAPAHLERLRDVQGSSGRSWRYWNPKGAGFCPIMLITISFGGPSPAGASPSKEWGWGSVGGTLGYPIGG